MAPWLDKCRKLSALCWYVLVGSGGRLDEGGPVEACDAVEDRLQHLDPLGLRVTLLGLAGRALLCPDFCIPQTDLVVFAALTSTLRGPWRRATVPTLSVGAAQLADDGGRDLEDGGRGCQQRSQQEQPADPVGRDPDPHADAKHQPDERIHALPRQHRRRGAIGRVVAARPDAPPRLVAAPSLVCLCPRARGIAGGPPALRGARSSGHAECEQRALEIFAVFAPVAEQEPPASSPFGISVLVGGTDQKGTDIGYDSTSSAAFLGGLKAPLSLGATEALRLHVYVDACLVEVIANNQTLLSAQVVTPDASFDGLAVFGPVGAQSIDVWGMTGIWRESER